MIDIGRALQHPFEDKDWATKMLIGVGVSLVPVLNFALNGYALDVLNNTARGQDVPLPKWDDLGKHFVEGLKLFVVELIYAIPILVLAFGFVIVGIGFGIEADNMGRSARNTFASGFTVIALAVTCLCFLYGLVYAFLTPAMYIQVARTGDIGAAFRFNEISALIKRNPGDYILVVLIPVIIGAVLGIVFAAFGLIPFLGLCLIVLVIPLSLLVTPYAYIVTGHLYGQLIKA